MPSHFELVVEIGWLQIITTWNAKCPIFLGNFTPKTSNYCLKNRALGFPGMGKIGVSPSPSGQKFSDQFPPGKVHPKWWWKVRDLFFPQMHEPFRWIVVIGPDQWHKFGNIQMIILYTSIYEWETTWSGAHRWPYVFLDFGYFVPRFTMFLCFFLPNLFETPFVVSLEQSQNKFDKRCRISAGLFPRYITGLDMCKVCTEAVHCVALWTRVTSQVWTCVRHVPKQSSA